MFLFFRSAYCSVQYTYTHIYAETYTLKQTHLHALNWKKNFETFIVKSFYFSTMVYLLKIGFCTHFLHFLVFSIFCIHWTLFLDFVIRLGVVHKWCHGPRGERGQGFYDNSTKAFVIKSVTMGGGGSKNVQWRNLWTTSYQKKDNFLPS